jgi:hypothetical protein
LIFPVPAIFQSLSSFRCDSAGQPLKGYTRAVEQRKIFWLLVGGLGTLAGFVLPLLWSVLATLPIFAISWWIVYRSDWF